MENSDPGLIYQLKTIYKHYLDKTMRYPLQRWIIWFVLLAYYGYRIYTCQGFYLITYALGLYILNLFLGFVSPLEDPEFNDDNEGDLLPTKETDEFKPFIRRVPEFTFWYESIKMILMSLLMTFNKAFDVPVFWPILVVYFLSLCFMTLKQRISHMIKYKYVPWTKGKATYANKK